METMNASYFKARCLKILDRVRETGERIVILKRGEPVAELGPPSRTESQYPQAELKGTATVIGDIVGPVVPEHHWDSLAGAGATPGGPTPAEAADEAGARKPGQWKGGE
ncbi:MAG: type II toxin-antitoxin system Phd/YefM family antitoxin [Gemmatimonadetes bacterium]|nr:type II toxin-antitoxin system Phd/YefM family antitoxin [Gemmatimonadota bacterium]MCY3678923.1 type II toxin-antitoxin system Phd/YefM family antitoxin [Gemmatimonadota bacterium]MYA43976.1 type II toxin-antitoxin system Phd/YefM family antitoxin [Gemmatimonadota bacterium]MYE93454.1 type II toxin-antitoxin system Phd/YefM family antitoxin [Gemmatimonadota bacterium]MYJ10994.1 type II toxin-antitoxin system Phd/YefM family antitoxin [Gemmatimonadota bacterium]